MESSKGIALSSVKYSVDLSQSRPPQILITHCLCMHTDFISIFSSFYYETISITVQSTACAWFQILDLPLTNNYVFQVNIKLPSPLAFSSKNGDNSTCTSQDAIRIKYPQTFEIMQKKYLAYLSHSGHLINISQSRSPDKQPLLTRITLLAIAFHSPYIRYQLMPQYAECPGVGGHSRVLQSTCTLLPPPGELCAYQESAGLSLKLVMPIVFIIEIE